MEYECCKGVWWPMWAGHGEDTPDKRRQLFTPAFSGAGKIEFDTSARVAKHLLLLQP
jgi:hypothetical protein